MYQQTDEVGAPTVTLIPKDTSLEKQLGIPINLCIEDDMFHRTRQHGFPLVSSIISDEKPL